MSVLEVLIYTILVGLVFYVWIAVLKQIIKFVDWCQDKEDRESMERTSDKIDRFNNTFSKVSKRMQND